MVGDLLYTLEEVAGPADAAGDASFRHIFCSSAVLFRSFVDAIEAYEIEINWPLRPNRASGNAVVVSNVASV